MKKFWLVFVTVAAAMGAAGDITGVSIAANGWQASVYISGLDTNGTFSFGLGANNSIGGAEKFTLALDSQGYDTTGTTAVHRRTIYGTKQVRFAYPNEAYPNTTNAGGTTTILMALSDYVYAGDSNLTAKIGAGLYTHGGTPTSAVSGLAVTNSSTQTYPQAIANWLTVPYQNASGNYELSVKAYQAYGAMGKPVAAVRFIARDGHGNSYTNLATQVLRSTAGRPVSQWVATMDPSGFASGDVVTNAFEVYPWIGVVLNSTNSPFAVTQPQYHNIYGRFSTQNVVVAVVSTTNNFGANGAATNVFDASNPPSMKAFASISQAARAIADTNNALYGINQAYGIIYLRGGSHSFVGTAASPPTTQPDSWLTLTNFPGDGRDGTSIANGTGNGDIQDRIALRGLTIAANEAFTFSGCSNLWFDGCVLNVSSSSADVIDGTTFAWFTGNTVSNWDQGFQQQGSQSQVFMVHGNYIAKQGLGAHPYFFVGNHVYTNAFGSTYFNTALAGLPHPAQEVIIADNVFEAVRMGGATWFTGWNLTQNLTNGAAVVNNAIECIDTNLGSGLVILAGDSSTGNVTNLMLWNNTVVGGKFNLAYNDSGTAAAHRILWSLRDNFIGDGNIKSDTFGTQNANRVGNWPVLYGVNCYGNLWAEAPTGITAAGDFLCEFVGMNSYQPSATGQPPSGSDNTTNWMAFQSYRATIDSSALGLGYGDYRLRSESYGIRLERRQRGIGWDLSGLPRGQFDPPGAYASGNARRGGFF